MFRLDPPAVTLVLQEDSLPGGLSNWGSGSLEVTVDGSVSLGEFLDLAARFAAMANSEDDSSAIESMRDALTQFGGRIRAWTIEGVPATPDGYLSLPRELALAIFSAWQRATSPSPNLSAVSANGVQSQVGLAGTAA